jgi:hypothetical protein
VTRALVLVLVLAPVLSCKKKSDVPKLFLDGGPAATKADAAATPADAPPAPTRPVPDKLAVSEHASCALMSDESVRCWGLGDQNQLGDGLKRDSPVPIDPKLRGVKDLVASRAFVCALLDDRSVACWGGIGFGAAAQTPKPAGVSGVTKAQRIFAVGGAACAAIDGGALVCWGDVDERGRITNTGAHRAPTAVAGMDHVAALAERAALREDGDLVYWDGTTPKRALIDDGKEIASAGDTACVLRGNHRAYCMQSDADCNPKSPPPAPAPAKPAKGKPKPGKKPPPPKPAPPPEPKVSLRDLPFNQVTHLAFDYGGTCVIQPDQRVWCVDPASACHMVANMKPVPAIDELSAHCGRKHDGTVVCWRNPGERAIPISGVAHATDLVARYTQGCALDRDHHVACWKATDPATPVPFE